MSLPHAICTVVIPCYNGAAYLEAAVDSVRAQTFPDHHLVLVDDASTDGTRQLIHRLARGHAQTTVLELPENRGRSCARNLGAKRTHSPYLCFLDQDDTYHPGFLAVTTSVLNRFANLDAVKVAPDMTIDIDPVRRQVVANSLATTMLIRRGVFEFVGGWPVDAAFREHPGGNEDIALLHLLGAGFNVGQIDRKLYRYTHRPGNALDRFLRRSSVVDGKLVFADANSADDLRIAQVTERLVQEVRLRMRNIILQHIAANQYTPEDSNL